MSKIKYSYLYFLLISTTLSFAQSSLLKKYDYSLNLHYGAILKHSENMAHLANQHPWGLELSATKQTIGRKQWEQIYNYPKTGFSALFFKMDPSKPLGNCYGLILHIGNTFLKNPRLNYRVGMGPGFVFKTFNIRSNFRDNLISSHINYCINARLNYKLIAKENFNINLGIGLTHFSNGGIKVPNLGINIPTIHLGINFVSNKNLQFLRDSLGTYDQKLHLVFFGAMGLKESPPVGGPKYLLSTFSAGLMKPVNRKSVLNASLDFFYDPSARRNLNDNSLKFKKLSKIGIAAGHELLINKVGFLTQFGFYLYNPTHLNKNFYQRFSLKYYLNKNIFLALGLKTHFANADFVECTLGYKL